MKPKLLLLAFSAAILTSCSTYKAGQTPDDVYYSPAREVTSQTDVTVNKPDRYESIVSSQDDRYLRMKIQNRNRWAVIDDYDYWYDSRYNHCYCNGNDYGYGYNNSRYNFNPYRNNYFGYGGSYSPNYPIVYYKNPRVYTGNTGKANLTTYSNRSYNNQNNANTINKAGTQNSNFGNLMKRVFSTSSNSNDNGSTTQTSWDRPVRTVESGTTTSSSAGGQSGGYNSSGSSSSTARPPR